MSARSPGLRALTLARPGSRFGQLGDRPARRDDSDVRDRQVAKEEAGDHEGREEGRPIGGIQEAVGLHQQEQAKDKPADGPQQGSENLDELCHGPMSAWMG